MQPHVRDLSDQELSSVSGGFDPTDAHFGIFDDIKRFLKKLFGGDDKEKGPMCETIVYGQYWQEGESSGSYTESVFLPCPTQGGGRA